MNEKIIKKAWKIYCFPNGMIVTFSLDGEQIPDLQGKDTPELREKIRKNSERLATWNQN